MRPADDRPNVDPGPSLKETKSWRWPIASNLAGVIPGIAFDLGDSSPFCFDVQPAVQRADDACRLFPAIRFILVHDGVVLKLFGGGLALLDNACYLNAYIKNVPTPFLRNASYALHH